VSPIGRGTGAAGPQPDRIEDVGLGSRLVATGVMSCRVPLRFRFRFLCCFRFPL
jgi:hypothetical protein